MKHMNFVQTAEFEAKFAKKNIQKSSPQKQLGG